MTVFLADHAKENARLVQFLWVLIIMKLMQTHVLTAELAQGYAR